MVASAVEQNQATAGLSGNAFRERMECQCQEIAQYRLAALREGGRELSMEEAALEWIERHAADFARRTEFRCD